MNFITEAITASALSVVNKIPANLALTKSICHKITILLLVLGRRRTETHCALNVASAELKHFFYLCLSTT